MFPTVSCLLLTLVLSLTGVDSATFFGFSLDFAMVRITLGIEQEVLFVLCVCCHLFWQKIFYVTVSFTGCHWQCGERTLTRSGSEASPGHCDANRSFSNVEKRWTEDISQRLCGLEKECGHFESFLGRGGNLTVVGLTPMWVGATWSVDVAFIDCGGTEGEPQVSIQLRTATRTWLELAASLFVMR